MFSSSLSTLKKRTTGLGGLLNEVTDKVGNVARFQGPSGKSTDDVDIPLSSEGPFFVRYMLQNDDDEDRESAVFTLPSELLSHSVTQATVREHFPIPGSFYFRFKYATEDGAFGGYVWLDLPDESAKVPVFMGGISMKVLRMPTGGVARAPTPPMSQQLPSQLPQGGAADMPSFDPDPRPAPAPAAPSKLAPGPPGDMLEFDVGPKVPAAPPAAPVVMPDRGKLIAEREKNKQDRIDAANAKHEEQKQKEEDMKKSKVELGNKLGEELDGWAKTANGSNFKDIRSLLVTLHEVMWEESGWKPLGMSELIQDGRIKRNYHKAILLVHPDKQQDNAEQQVRADRIFNALNESYNKERG